MLEYVLFQIIVQKFYSGADNHPRQKDKVKQVFQWNIRRSCKQLLLLCEKQWTKSSFCFPSFYFVDVKYFGYWFIGIWAYH